MPKLIELESSSLFRDSKITEVLIRKTGENEYKHHCHAIVLAEASDGFILLCAIPCVEQIGYSFYVRRNGHQDPVSIRLSAEESHILVQGKDFGHIHRGADF